MKRSVVVALLCFSMTSLSVAQSQAGMITLQEVSNRQTVRLAQQALDRLNSPEAEAQLRAFGISPDEARTRLAALSDKEITEMLNTQSGEKVGGDVIVISLTTVLLILIIVLLLR